jgi:hypothetical protein
MHSTNRRCNALQSLVGIFLHSCGAPETVRELLARIGLSISTTTINEAVNHLSEEAAMEIRKEGQTLLTSYAYDNLDINLKHTTPTVEQSADTLYHLTTATMLPLRGDISSSDLNCAERVWKQSATNAASGQLRPTITLEDIMSIHKEPATPHPSGLQTRQQRFNAGIFLSDLIEYGPEYFRQFRGKLEEPEVVDAIPPEKTTQLPMRAMDVKPDTPAQNAEAVKGIFKQASVG